MTVKKYCNECGKEFIAKRYNATYCSAKCRNRHNIRIYNKKIKDITLEQREKRYCNMCGADITKEDMRKNICVACERYIEECEKEKREEKIYCATCGVLIEDARKNQKYCSDKCRWRMRQIKETQKAKKESELERRKKCGKLLINNEARARELGLSYGQYMSVKEGRQPLEYFMKLYTGSA